MENSTDKVVELLSDIKKLLILSLADKGVAGKRIAEVLDVDPAVISRILSSKRSKKK
jgi:predicted transcriptional regulator